jgi:hypothetical protein
MAKRERLCMKAETRRKLVCLAIQFVSDERMAESCKVNANLMPYPGANRETNDCVMGKTFQ